MGDEGGMTRVMGESERERKRERSEGRGEEGRERWRTSRSLCSIRIKHPPVRKKFGVFTPQTRCSPQTSQIRKKCAENAQHAREVNFFSPFRADPVAHPCCKLLRRSASVKICCCRDFMFLRDVSATLPQLRDGEEKFDTNWRRRGRGGGEEQLGWVPAAMCSWKRSEPITFKPSPLSAKTLQI